MLQVFILQKEKKVNESPASSPPYTPNLFIEAAAPFDLYERGMCVSVGVRVCVWTTGHEG